LEKPYLERKFKVRDALLWSALILGCVPGLAEAGRRASGDIYFTRSMQYNNVAKMTFAYDGQSKLTFGAPVNLLRVREADEIIRLPNGKVLTSAPNFQSVFRANLVGGLSETWKDRWERPSALNMDPALDKVWVADNLTGRLFTLPADSLVQATEAAVTGDDTKVMVLTFRSAGEAWYGNSTFQEGSNFGFINPKTLVTQRLLHYPDPIKALRWDKFSDDVFICAGRKISQFDPTSGRIVSEREYATDTQFRSCLVDGEGHLFVAEWKGEIYFIDYSGSGLIGDSTRNFEAHTPIIDGIHGFMPFYGPGAFGPRPSPPKGEVRGAYRDRDGNGRIDEAVLELANLSADIPPLVQLQDPFAAGRGVTLDSTRITADDAVHLRIDFADQQFTFGTVFPTGPLGRILRDTAHFSDAPFPIADEVGPLALEAAVTPSTKAGEGPTLKVTYSEPVEGDPYSRASPFQIRRQGQDAGADFVVEAVKVLSDNVIEYRFTPAGYPQAGDSLRIIPGTPALADNPGNLSNMGFFIRVSGPPPPAFTVRTGPLPCVLTMTPLSRLPLASSILLADSSQPGVCLNCFEGRVGSDLAQSLASADSRYQPYLFSLTLRTPAHYAIKFYSNSGEFINEAEGDLTPSLLQGLPRDSEGNWRVRFYWWPLTARNAIAATGAYVARGIVSSAGGLGPGPVNAEEQPSPPKREKISIIFGYLRH
jgi:hypothetical protein